MDNGHETTAPGRRYRWPWLLLAAVALAFLLAVLWLRPVIHSIREQRQMNPPSNPTEP